MSNTTTCPSCKRPLRIPDELVGQQVKCPACSTTFAANPDAEAPAAPRERERESKRDPDPAERRGEREERRREERPRDDRPQEDDERPVRRQRDADEDDRPRRRHEEDDDEDEDDRPRRRKRRSDYDDHRGTLILILGICSFVVLPIPFGPIAWFLGNADLKEIRAGRMDPEGEGTTQIGRILGMVATLLFLVGMLIVCLLVAIFAFAAGVK